MAARLTDRQKKKIIADYIQVGSYNAVAKANKVSGNTVKKIVKGNAEIAAKYEQKKAENTADVIAYMESQRKDVCEVLKLYLDEMKDPQKVKAAGLKELATAMAILIDKYTANLTEDRSGREPVKIVVDWTGNGEYSFPEPVKKGEKEPLVIGEG